MRASYEAPGEYGLICGAGCELAHVDVSTRTATARFDWEGRPTEVVALRWDWVTERVVVGYHTTSSRGIHHDFVIEEVALE